MTRYFNNDVRTLEDACNDLLRNYLKNVFAGDAKMLMDVATFALFSLCDTLSGMDGGRMGGHPLIKVINVCDECDEDIWDEFSWHEDGDKIVHDNCCVTCNSNPFHKD